MGESGKIYQAIPAIMGEIDAVGKNQKNAKQGFMYRGVDDVMNAINPALVKHKVFIVPEILDQKREERKTNTGANLIYSICQMKFRFFAEDGSSVEAVTIGEGMDSGDKATNKAMAVAFKYACFQIFCIPTAEMKDPDADSHAVQPKPQDSQGQDATEEQKNREMVEQGNKASIDAVKIKVLRDTIRQKGVSEKSVLQHYKMDAFEKMTMAHWTNAMQMLEKYPDKKESQ